MAIGRPDRRKLLGAITGAVAALAGCPGSDESGTEAESPRDEATPTEEPTATPDPTPEPKADIELDASIREESVLVGEAVHVDVTVRNRGKADGETDLTLTVDGNEIATDHVEVAAGEERTVELGVDDAPRPGTFTFVLNGETVGSVTVEEQSTLYVAPDGDDENRGLEDEPLATIQTALERARPGHTIDLAPGEYRELLFTVRDGEADAPITITGPSEAVIRPPPGSDDCLKIEHSHVHVRGMTIDGLLEPDRRYEDYEAWATRCVFVSPVGRKEEGVEYVRDVVVEPSRLGNAAGPIVQTQRIRDCSIGNFEVIGPAGMKFDDRVENHVEGHVREIVYIGSPEVHRGRSYYRYETLDRCRNVRIHHIDNSEGYRHNELVDVKLGSTDITVEYCTDRNAGHNSEGAVDATIDLKGNDCTVRWNDLGESPLPFSLGSWAPSDDVDGDDWSQNNEIYGNYIHGFVAGPFRLRNEGDVGPASLDEQRILCGNRIERGSLALEPWIGEPNGFDGTADRRGQEEVTVDVGAGPDGRAIDPAVVYVDPETDVTWKWTGDGGKHYIVREGRINQDPEDVPDPLEGPYSETHTLHNVGLYRFACYNHHGEGMRASVIAVGDESRYEGTQKACESVPDGDGIGHTGGDSP